MSWAVYHTALARVDLEARGTTDLLVGVAAVLCLFLGPEERVEGPA